MKLAKPVWPNKADAPFLEKTFTDRYARVEATNAAQRRPDPMELTIREGRDKYLELLKARIGLGNRKGINQNTFQKFKANLALAMALNPQYNRDELPIDVERQFSHLTEHDYQNFVQFWCRPSIVKSERTGLNYIRAFKQMLDGLRIRLPDGADEAFSLRTTAPPKIARYDPTALRTLLRCDDDRARLFQLLALNCGYYQVDIARLMNEQITDAEGNPYRSGEMFITKRRERTRHQNVFATTCFVWPETQELIEQLRARSNAHDAVFLNSHGTTYDEDTISGVVLPVIKAAGLFRQFSFKQFRKIGASQIKAMSGSDAMHQYKANALSAADKPYILEDYSILTAALKKFRDKLKADGVL